MEERAKRIHSEQLGQISGYGAPKYIALDSTTSTYSMKPTDLCLIVTSSVADGSGIVYLPSLIEAAGRIYSIHAPTGATGGDISVYEKETGSEYAGQDTDDGDLDADADNIVLFSNGVKWITLHNGVA